MSLNTTSAKVRPYSGRDPEFAAAMERAERAATPVDAGPNPLDPVGKTRNGSIVRRDGTFFTPGLMFDRDVLESLPLVG